MEPEKFLTHIEFKDGIAAVRICTPSGSISNTSKRKGAGLHRLFPAARGVRGLHDLGRVPSPQRVTPARNPEEEAG